MKKPNPLEAHYAYCKGCNLLHEKYRLSNGKCFHCTLNNKIEASQIAGLMVFIASIVAMFFLYGCEDTPVPARVMFAHTPLGYTDFVKFTQENK